jgi:glycine cleavage system aminomethyltransferase T
MKLSNELEVLRSSVGLTRMGHVAVVRIVGDDAFALLDMLSPRALFLRESQVRHTLLLHEDASIFADVYMAYGEDGHYLFAEGCSEEELLNHLHRCIEQKQLKSLMLQGLSSTYELWDLNGPFAWELAAAVLGAPVLGMPFLTLLHAGEIICLRGGKTGEFGYSLLAPKGDGLQAKIEEAGPAFGLQTVSLAALDRCSLENWHFCIRSLRKTRWDPLTPLELQLQWRVSYERDFIGSSALRARRERGIEVRATCFCTDAEVSAGQSLWLGNELVGEVLSAGWSHARSEWVGSALLQLAVAHPGVSLKVLTPNGETITTKSTPLLNNLSLYVDPHRHSFQTKGNESFPPLVIR